ncbi:MAG TPA: MBL fold metallo-hydrolase [Blastocatellia bacterium]|nr:MBL fold metallo-hydrolase [Blastocatellia bacterium]
MATTLKTFGATVLALMLTTLAAGRGIEGPEPQQGLSNPQNPLRDGEDQKEAMKVADGIYEAFGFGNTFMVTTSEGNVIIDTSSVFSAPRHVKLLKAVSAGPIKYIILTHGHGDHTGGIPLWKGPGTKIIAQQNHVEFLNYQTRLAGFFAERNAAQFNFARPAVREWAGDYGAKIDANILFDDKYEFTLGGIKFEIYHTPGETPDHLTVWIPQYKAAFCGDNYYMSFPNMYTLRGTEPRWALDYVNSLNKVMSFEPEIVLPSHGPPIHGKDEVKRRLTRYRDAIQYVHDQVVRGMNAGKDVFTLMREIKLPPELEVGEGYGKLTWSIRGIYEGYAGWFDMNPATMYDTPASSVYPDLVKLAGGTDAVIKLAAERIQQGRLVDALRLSEVALAADPDSPKTLEARLSALQALHDGSRNSNERGWLEYSINQVKAKLGRK